MTHQIPVQDTLQLADTIANEFIRKLEKDDAGRKRTLHQSSINKLKKELVRFRLEAQRSGVDIRDKEPSPQEIDKAFLASVDLLLLGASLLVGFALIITIWAGA